MRCYSEWSRDRKAYKSGPFSPFSFLDVLKVTSKNPLRADREGFTNKTQESHTTKEKIDKFVCVKSVSTFVLKKAPKIKLSKKSTGRRCL